ncbi:MAG: UDP-N-acetylglucosamine 1-carboxyvinyltransferase, partial [Acidobacteria bacterium]|nr:UDP-N-acetylglucosamine 1-carboxyvinyltransferase [Acidobacteriota bacterium]
MDRFRILGPTRLTGTVEASGAKNASLPAMAASLLSDEPLALERVPRVQDIATMGRLLAHLGVEPSREEDLLTLAPNGNGNPDEAPYELVK